MRMAMVGLGRMGGNMARRLLRGGIQVVGFNRTRAVAEQLAEEDGLIVADNLADAVARLDAPRVVWLMLPAGSATESHLDELIPLLDPGDVVVDGGNANYHDSERRARRLADHDIEFVDAGTSGGIWGLDNGYCLMVGGSERAVRAIEPALKALAPAQDRGWAHVGPAGAGHFTKMIHNGIEYGMMQAFAEGFALLKGKQAYHLDLAQIAELWRHGSVVRSWLLDLTADTLAQDQVLADIAPVVADSGEGRWTAKEAIDQGVAAPVISMALAMRFASQDAEGYGNRVLAMMRNAFGGHAVEKK
ncbi:phosphogluconate dehydrogenase (NAD(+)-dependent, decarboxylating) [Thioalkalivibrio sulfidiphilus]|uniref:6-phosphogluconate dehydrogenase-like protein n=1 Tax=Thioalkalivibrio sulfidiphilus (strain HL-EbGR7) TaxID=396588 RepID=B8GNA3_THISH|nr:decarboxylating 6-phosphogluconate dehydrogenase [Thioalkalivibrio sulfidiphilus]ACL71964.1 6-phosphogluconate dehydrogenase-like protein [Thioalkalivibrio sulfidiphilus HL-EbGr7]